MSGGTDSGFHPDISKDGYFCFMTLEVWEDKEHDFSCRRDYITLPNLIQKGQGQERGKQKYSWTLAWWSPLES